MNQAMGVCNWVDGADGQTFFRAPQLTVSERAVVGFCRVSAVPPELQQIALCKLCTNTHVPTYHVDPMDPV